MPFFLQLRAYLRPYLPLILISAVLAIPLSALRLAPAPLVKYVVDDLLVRKDAALLGLFPIVMIGIYVVNFAVRFVHYYLIRIVITRVNQRLKNDLVTHLLGLSADYFADRSSGALVSRVGSDPNLIDGGIGNIHTAIREPITFVSLFGYALYLNWKLTLVILLLFPLLAWVFTYTGKSLKRYSTKMQEENANLYSALQETFSGFRVVKAFRLENYLQKKFEDRNAQFARFSLKMAAVEEASHPLVELFTGFAIAAVIYYGGTRVLAGEMSAGDLLSFFVAFALMMDPIRRLNDINLKFTQATAASTRVMEIFAWKSRITEKRDAPPMRPFARAVEFKEVAFKYPDDPTREILGGVSFEVPKGSVIAVVGRSGAGKSSLVSLLPRLYDVTGGRILVDGVDVRDLPLSDLRSQVAVVSQDVFLFNDTIYENIRCGRLDATEADVREAARQAFAIDFIERAPQGFASVIGDRGQKLSGGERQRISIARAFLRKAPVLILDEATSNLDPASEKFVQRALEDLMKDRTTLVIAHRLSTVRHADQILVLRSGKIVERGTHDQLLSAGGEYAELNRLHEITV
ncbi:MAG: ATP-binding cassette domain-containing protein [Bdellovibrionales bacterium]|nr:ATP-binding cassette domain-containing protein [Bdellovibrionales bacterium]